MKPQANPGEPTEQVTDAKSDFPSIVRNWMLVLAAYAYFAGWIYAYSLFSRFGLSLHAIEIPAYYFFVYSYFALPDVTITNVAVAVFLTAVVITLLYVSRRYALHWLLAGTLLALIPAVFSLAQEQALSTSVRMRDGQANTIRLVLKPEIVKQLPKDFIDANSQNRLRVLTETKDRFYVFYQPVGTEKELPYGYTFNIAKSDVLLVTVEMQNVAREGDGK